MHVLIYFIFSGVPNMQYVHHPVNRLHVLLFYYGKNSKHAIFSLDQRTCLFFCISEKKGCFLHIAENRLRFFLFLVLILKTLPINSPFEKTQMFTLWHYSMVQNWV